MANERQHPSDQVAVETWFWRRGVPNLIDDYRATGGTGSAKSLLNLTLFGSTISLTTELIKVTGFLMAFSSLHFTVSAITDATYRAEFFDDLTSEIRDALAVRVVYLNRLSGEGGGADVTDA